MWPFAEHEKFHMKNQKKNICWGEENNIMQGLENKLQDKTRKNEYRVVLRIHFV
jgi:hypothetical protein